MKNITFCKICSIEINKPLLYEHIKSKEHKEIEKYLIINCMTYCEVCKKGIRNDEWREHIISENHLEIEKKLIAMFARRNTMFLSMGVITLHSKINVELPKLITICAKLIKKTKRDLIYILDRFLYTYYSC